MRTPAEAIAWSLRQSRWAPHSCLNFVKNAYYGDAPTQNSIDGKPYLSDALDGWRNSTMKHYDRNPPVGALMYFDGVNADDPGDVQIHIGNGLTRRTDVGGWGIVATTSIWWMENVVGRKYRGWTGDILGRPYFGVASQATSKPAQTKEDEDDVNPVTIAENQGERRLMGQLGEQLITFSAADYKQWRSNRNVKIVYVTTRTFNKLLKGAI